MRPTSAMPKYSTEILLVCFVFCWLALWAQAASFRHLTRTDFNNAKRLKENKGNKDKHYNSGKFEGDIELDGKSLDFYKKQKKDKSSQIDDGRQSNALVDTSYKWEGGVVPYLVSSEFTAYEKSRIADAIDVYHANTCVKFVPRTTQTDYVLFVKEGGCWSYVGRNGGAQKISIDDGCVYTGIIQHEMMHAVGFFHEQSRTDRDSYVTILWNNIISGYEDNFQKYGLDRITDLGVAYDYGSVMHYGPTAFSRNGSPTIQAPQSIGQRDGLSSIDVEKLNKLYECGTVTTTTTATTTTTTPAATTTTTTAATTTTTPAATSTATTSSAATTTTTRRRGKGKGKGKGRGGRGHRG